MKKHFLMNQKGFSLIEIMIAVIILASMATVVVSNVASQHKKAQVSQTKILLSQVSNSLEMFYRDCSFYPTADEGLDALLDPVDRCPSWGPEPYLTRGYPKDPWSNELVYEYDETSGLYEIFSLGSDKKEGGEGYATDLSSRDDQNSQ